MTLALFGYCDKITIVIYSVSTTCGDHRLIRTINLKKIRTLNLFLTNVNENKKLSLDILTKINNVPIHDYDLWFQNIETADIQWIMTFYKALLDIGYLQ